MRDVQDEREEREKELNKKRETLDDLESRLLEADNQRKKLESSLTASKDKLSNLR